MFWRHIYVEISRALARVIPRDREGYKQVLHKCDQAAVLALSHVSYSWLAHQLQVWPSLGRRRNLVQFQTWDQFWIPQPKLHGTMYLVLL